MIAVLVNVFPDEEETSKAATNRRRGRGARPLIEDNEINQQIAVELLGRGAVVTVANNGREAVESCLFDRHHRSMPRYGPQMPEMDGYQATAKLRSDTRFATLPIIAMTAHATIEERQPPRRGRTTTVADDPGIFARRATL
jgi:two-component system sensor histidine kinase/response regulator